jgi:hypothetical protein
MQRNQKLRKNQQPKRKLLRRKKNNFEFRNNENTLLRWGIFYY